MGNLKQCYHCNANIEFRKNSAGKWITFNSGTDRCHYETCTSPKMREPPRPKSNPFYKNKIPYKVSQKCHKLSEYKEDEK